MLYLKQSTASQSILIGPFVDDTNGVTLKTSLTINNTDILLSKNGSSLSAKNSGGGTHDQNAWYTITLDATDTDTVGILQLTCKVTGALTVFADCQILEESVYDALIASGATGDLLVDVAKISGDSTAADNLELQFDGTGLSGGNYPATQSQLGSVAVAGAAVNATAGSYTLTTGTQSSGTYSSTNALDGTYHEHTDDAGTLDLYYEFDIGADGLPTSSKFTGYVNGSGDDVDIYAYNWSGASWDQVGTVTGQASATNIVYTFDLFTSHVGTGGNAGLVRIKFNSTGLSSATLACDQLLCSYTQSVSGIPNGTTVTLASSSVNQNLIGRSWSLALGGQDISGAYVDGCIDISGIATGTNGQSYSFDNSNMVTCTLGAFGYFNKCYFGDVVTFSSTSGVTSDEINFIDCCSSVAGSGSPEFVFSSVSKATSISFRRWSGGIKLTGLTSDCTVSIDGVSGGNVTIDGTGGSVNVRGMFESIVDNSGGSVTIDQDGLVNIEEVNDTVDQAMVDIHLDHLFATDYDPASKPGTSTALLNELVESDGGVSRFTSNSLEAVLASGDVDGYTMEEALKLMLAAMAGKLSGGGTATIIIRAADDSKERITATVTDVGNRTSITLDAS